MSKNAKKNAKKKAKEKAKKKASSPTSSINTTAPEATILTLPNSRSDLLIDALASQAAKSRRAAEEDLMKHPFLDKIMSGSEAFGGNLKMESHVEDRIELRDKEKGEEWQEIMTEWEPKDGEATPGEAAVAEGEVCEGEIAEGKVGENLASSAASSSTSTSTEAKAEAAPEVRRQLEQERALFTQSEAFGGILDIRAHIEDRVELADKQKGDEWKECMKEW